MKILNRTTHRGYLLSVTLAAMLFSLVAAATDEQPKNWKDEASGTAGDWMRSPWLGPFLDRGDWIYNEIQGWWFTHDDGAGGFHFFDPEIRSWAWISEATHPWAFEHGADGGWKVRQIGILAAMENIHSAVEADLLVNLVNEADVNRRMSDMNPGGYWPDIDYSDKDRFTGWQHPRHLSNLLIMAQGYRHHASYIRGNRNLLTAIMAALDYWLEHDFVPDNSAWHRTVDTPIRMARIMILMRPWLSEEQLEAGLKIISRAVFEPGESAMIYLGINAKRAVLARDARLLRQVMRAIDEEVHIAGVGDLRLQADLSFQHRPDRVNYTLSYGTRLPEFFIPWAVRTAGTPFHVGLESMQLMVDYSLDGIGGHAAFGVFPDPAGYNREISRRGEWKPLGPRLPEALLKVTNYRYNEIEALAARRKGLAVDTPSHNREFWRSDYMSHQRSEYFVSVRAYSKRNHSTDRSVGREGVKLHHFADGSSFLQRHGKEFEDVFPVWDWQMIPGVTVVQEPGLNGPKVDLSYGAGKLHLEVANPQVPGVSTFVGGVSDGLYGAAVFDFESVHQDLSARKAWFFFDEEYVALGAGIRSASTYPVVTSLNQCNLLGAVTLGTADGMAEAQAGLHEAPSAHWVHHDDVAYVLLQDSEVRFRNATQQGGWHWITEATGASQNAVEREIFRLWIDHGVQPDGESYAYAVLPGVDTARAVDYHASPAVEILENSTALQAVIHHDLGLLMAVFYDAGSVELTDSLRIEAQQPMLVQARISGDSITEVYVSDPTQLLSSGEVEITDESGSRFLDITFPQGVYAGKSIELDLSE